MDVADLSAEARWTTWRTGWGDTQVIYKLDQYPGASIACTTDTGATGRTEMYRHLEVETRWTRNHGRDQSNIERSGWSIKVTAMFRVYCLSYWFIQSDGDEQERAKRWKDSQLYCSQTHLRKAEIEAAAVTRISAKWRQCSQRRRPQQHDRIIGLRGKPPDAATCCDQWDNVEIFEGKYHEISHHERRACR